jgi:hypothetical protein
MRKTIEEIKTNIAYRWFLGFGFHDKVPHFSTFGKNYDRRFKDTDLFEQIFYRILKEASDKNLISGEHVLLTQPTLKQMQISVILRIRLFVKKLELISHAFKMKSIVTVKNTKKGCSHQINLKRKKIKKSRKVPLIQRVDIT